MSYSKIKEEIKELKSNIDKLYNKVTGDQPASIPVEYEKTYELTPERFGCSDIVTLKAEETKLVKKGLKLVERLIQEGKLGYESTIHPLVKVEGEMDSRFLSSYYFGNHYDKIIEEFTNSKNTTKLCLVGYRLHVQRAYKVAVSDYLMDIITLEEDGKKDFGLFEVEECDHKQKRIFRSWFIGKILTNE